MTPGADSADFDQFAQAMWSAFLRAGSLMGLARLEAEDAAQEALLKCFKQWNRVSAAQNPEGYAVRIFQNGVVSGSPTTVQRGAPAGRHGA